MSSTINVNCELADQHHCFAPQENVHLPAFPKVKLQFAQFNTTSNIRLVLRTLRTSVLFRGASRKQTENRVWGCQWNQIFFFNSVLRPFQDYFSSYETGQLVGGQKRENPEKNHLAHPQAELGLSHM